MSDINRLIFGKAQVKKIVSIEVDTEGQAELFIQNEDGSIKSEFISNKFWILSDRPHGQGWVRLKGELHYKWGKQFSNRKEFYTAKNVLKDQDIYSISDSKESFMINKGYTYFQDLKPNEVSILSFDIETTGFSGTNDSLLLISNTYRSHYGKITRKLFAYDDYDNEGQMIEAWCNWVRQQNPSVICGHNIYSFDLKFLQEVADRENTQLLLGRDDSPIAFNNYESQFRKDGSQSYSYKKVRCYGRELVDTMFLAIKYDVGRKYESYGLKKIIEHEGIRQEGRVMYDASKIKDNYKNPVEFKKIKEYCIYDSDEALALYDLMIAPTFYMSRSVPKSFQAMIESATGSQINALLIRGYLQEGHSIPKATELTEHVEGGISFGIPKVHRNVLKFDIRSAYPHQILRFKLYDKNKDPEAYFYKMVKFFTEARVEYKKLGNETGDRYYKDLDASSKVFINSAYGVTNTPGISFNSPELAAKITYETREVIRLAIEWATSKPLEYWQVKDE